MTKRILVVEDHEDNRQILRDLLAHAGYDMIEAEDGEQGLMVAARCRPDLILMDIQLPILDGYEATPPPQGRSGSQGHTDHCHHLIRNERG